MASARYLGRKRSMGAALHVSRMGPCGPICELKKAVNHGVGWEGCHPLVVY